MVASAREDAFEYCHVSKHVLLSMLEDTLVLDGSVQEKEISRPMINGKIYVVTQTVPIHLLDSFCKE